MTRAIGCDLRAAALSLLFAVGLGGTSLAQEHGPEDGPDSTGHEVQAIPQGGGLAESGGAVAHGADHVASPTPVAPAGLATEAYRAANLAMHSAMEIEFSGNADIDFARGMIGHHQGAIDMARIVLEHGEDPDLRRFAEEVIAAQEAEIAFLRAWITEHAPE